MGGETVCSKASDHLHNLTTSSNNITNVSSIAGSWDEDIQKMSIDIDLKLRVLLLTHLIKMTIPISYTPGLVKGPFNYTAGDFNLTGGELGATVGTPISLSGTVKMMDAKSEEIYCWDVSDSKQDKLDA